MSPPSPYVLIAISNVNRAAAVRTIAAETLRLETIVVRDGDDAVQEITRRGAPAVLVVDLSLPRVDGFTIVRKLRRQMQDRSTHVVVVSAHESLRVAARELSQTLGISGILPLDADRATIRDAILAGTAQQIVEKTPQESAAAASRVTPSLDPEDVIDRATLDIRRRFQLPVSIGYLKHGDHERLMYHLAARESDPPMPLANLVDAAVLRQVALSSEPLLVPDIAEHPVFAGLAAGGPAGIRGFAAVPVGSGRDQARAALCLIDRKPLALSAAEVDALMAIGRHVGLELERARAATAPPERRAPGEMPDDVKALQHLASTDPLTGIANRRGGEKQIASEISRAKRERRPLGCLLLDIDRFKAVNDTFGHQAGDQVLRDLSALLRRTVRAYDILVRWGGEEFLLVLPGIGVGPARMLGERLRAAVESLDTHGVGSITVSAGAAEFGDDYDLASTLRAADQRLYLAKSQGRNRVV
jgi:diguanylate cyclase (GGDEF)-like protein